MTRGAPERPSVQGRDWPGVLRAAIREFREDDVSVTAQALAYSLFLAIPALLLVLLGAFSLLASDDLIDRLIRRLSTVMPVQAASLLRDSLRRTSDSASGSIAMTAVGGALAVWTTTSAAATLIAALTKAYDRDDSRGFVHRRLVAISLVAALVVAAGLAVGLVVLGPHLERLAGSATGAESAVSWIWWTAQWPILVVGLVAAFSVVLHLGPDSAHRGWQSAVPGAIVATGVWLAASGGFAAYSANFGSYDKTWGTLSAVVITLIWLWLTSAALLFGAEVNAEAQRRSATAEIPQ
ncbi:MAG: YihY/virulence factor BrkB family protein [Gaiella sp.]